MCSSDLVSGDFESALEFLELNEDVLCLSLPIWNPPTSSFQNSARGNQPSRCRAFIGCAHVMRRQTFLDLGGYNVKLWHQGEEMDLGARALLSGFRCMHFPGALVHHMESNEGRNWSSMDFYGARNAVLWNDWYVPDSQQGVRRRRRIAASFMHAVSHRRVGQLRGHWAAVPLRHQLARYRRRFSPEQFSEWLSLPFA